MTIKLNDGRLCLISNDGDILADNIGAYIEYGESSRMQAKGEWKLDTDGEITTAKCYNAEIRFEKHGNGYFIKTELYNDEDDIDSAVNFVPLDLSTPFTVTKMFGATVGNANGNRTNEMQTYVASSHPAPGEEGERSDFIAFETSCGRKYIVGFATSESWFGNLGYANGTSISFRQFTEYHPVKKDEKLTSDIIYITPVDDIVKELPAFTKTVADKTAEVRGIFLPENFIVPAGYCTWYYHYSHITGKAVLESLKYIKENKDTIPLKYYQIDDGWYDVWGNWITNDKFPEGMKFYAEQIKEAGLIPGIWIAPFGASTKSDIYLNHPEYFIRDREPEEGTDGRHLGSWGYYDLDFSVPEVCEYIGGVIRRLTYEWGFRYLKLDIITGSIGPYAHRDSSFNACRNFIKGLEVIKANVPEGTFLLLCTSPFISSLGYADGMRIGGDIGGSWDAARSSFRQVLNRYYYHNIFFANDADCLIIRKPENEDEECYHHCTRSDAEIRAYISAMAASGGAVLLSDKLNLLFPEQLRLISQLFPLNKTPALPLDLMDSETPEILDAGTRGKIRTVIFINWGEEKKEFSLDVGRKHAFEFWAQSYEGITEDTYRAEIAPHECKVMLFTDTDTPAIIGTDGEIISDIAQSYDGEKLTFDFVKKGETVTVYAGEVSGESCAIEKIGGNLWRVKQEGESLSASLTEKL